MMSGENSPPSSGLSLAPHEAEADSNKPVTPRSRTDELLANSSLSLVPVEEQSEAEQSVDADNVMAIVDENIAEDTALAETEPAPLTPTDAVESLSGLSDSNLQPDLVMPELDAVELSPEPVPVLEPEVMESATPETEVALADLVGVSDETAAPATRTENEVSVVTIEAIATEAESAVDADHSDDLSEVSTSSAAIDAAPLVDEPTEPEAEAFIDEHEQARQKAIADAEQDAAALFGQVTAPVSTTQEMPVVPAPVADEAVADEADVVATSTAVPADESVSDALALSPTPDHPVATKTGKAVFEAKPVHGQEEHVLEIPPPPVKKVDSIAVPEKPAPVQAPTKPIAETKPAAEPAPTTEKVSKPGLFGKIGEWKGHLSYLHTLYKEDPNTAVSHWKQTYKERDNFAQALNDLQERQTADNFAWEEIPRVLGQFHLREDDRGQADWYGDAARQYQAVLAALEKQKTFKPQLVQPLMKELKFIAEADAFHQKFGLSAIQQKVKTMYQTLQQRIDDYMKLQKQQLEIASKDKEIEKLRAQEAIATAEAQKVAQENRLVQEQRLKVVEDKKRLEAKRAAEEAERVRLERQREIEAEAAEARRREELSASFRAIEQEELMRKALQNMSLSQCAEGLLRQLFEKDQLNEQEKAAAARVLDVLKAKLS